MKVVFDGPESRFDVHYVMRSDPNFRFDLTFVQGVEVDVSKEVGTYLLTLNPRNLPVTVDPPYSGNVAGDYGMKVFRQIEEPPVEGETLGRKVRKGGDR